MKIVFFLPQGVIEWEVPEAQREGFSFGAFVANIRSAGFFLAPGIYLRHDTMIGIANAPDVMKPFSFPPVQGSA